MKKPIAILVALMAAAATSLAATQGSIVLKGTVPPTTDITVTPETGYDNLPLTTGASDQKVATVNEKTNIPRGYTVTLSSLNAGTSNQAVLKPADGANTDAVNYSLRYGGVAVTLASGQAVVTDANGRTGVNGTDKDLNVTFVASPWLAADTYTDTLTLTIAVK